MKAFALSVAVAAALSAGCGGDEAAAPPRQAGAEIISVAAAKRAGAGDPRRIRGYVVQAPNAYPHLCASLTQTDPPGCGRPSFVIEGPDPGTYGFRLEQRRGAQWTPRPVQMTGVIRENGRQLYIEEIER
jgi:hypothetical protein